MTSCDRRRRFNTDRMVRRELKVVESSDLAGVGTSTALESAIEPTSWVHVSPRDTESPRQAPTRIRAVDSIERNEALPTHVAAVIRATGHDQEPQSLGVAIATTTVGAAGVFLTVRLPCELERLHWRLGTVTMCIGGGQGMAAVLESRAA